MVSVLNSVYETIDCPGGRRQEAGGCGVTCRFGGFSFLARDEDLAGVFLSNAHTCP